MPSSAVVGGRVCGDSPRRWAELGWVAACGAGLIACLCAGQRRPSTPGAVISGAVGTVAAAQPKPDSNKPAAPPGPPGWSLVVLHSGAQPNREVKMWAPSASFTLRDGQSLDASIPSDAMNATYSGVVTIAEPGKYRFGTQAVGGAARLSLYDAGGKRLAEALNPGDPRGAWTGWVDVPAGTVSVSIQFTRASGPARLRTLWERAGTLDQGGFSPEPIAAGVVTPPKYTLRGVAASQSEFHGRVLMGELNCTGCHSAGPAQERLLTPRAAPLLGEIGRRAQPQWLLGWVSDPQSIKPGCGMPRVLGDSARDKADAEAITQFLVSLGGPADPQTSATEPQTLQIGRTLYHSVGCVACHGALEPAEKVFGADAPSAGQPEARPPQPFGHIAGKWRPGPLAEFLKDPLRTHPAGRMPSMLLTQAEADAIATYLVNAWGPGDTPGIAFKPDPSKVEAGKAAFAARGCASCHQLGGNQGAVATTLKAPALADLRPGAGCLAAGDTSSPRFGLSDQDRTDLAAAVQAVSRVIAQGAPATAPLDDGERLVAAYGCLNCHSRDEKGGVAESLKPYFRTVDDTELGDEGRLPPRLTGVGNKLNPPWMRAVLTEGGRARPYMAARMPQFGKLNVGRMHLLLTAMDGAPIETDNPAEPKATDELVLAGRTLVGEKGMNCISCHAYAGKTAGTAGLDITSFAERIRYDWFKSYVLAPARYKPGTRMTAFYASGHGPVLDVLSGDPDKQTDALWVYFATGKMGPAPEGLPTAGAGLPVAVGDKPVVFRTFMKDAGSRGIAVGYPIGLHFGFDATAVRLVDAWQGEFIDASAAWKGRGGQVADGQGKTLWSAPAGPPLVIGAKPERWPAATGHEAGYQFKGYRFEKDGTPVFMYTVASGETGTSAAPISVEERFVPRPKPGVLLARRFELTGLTPGQTVWMDAGKGQCAVVAATTLKTQDAPGVDGEHWFGVTSESAGAASFTVEITP